MSGNDPLTDPLSDIERLIEEFKHSGLRELHARCGDLEVYLSQESGALGLDAPRVSVSAPAGSPVRAASSETSAEAPPAAAPERDWPENANLVRAPYLGTFYRAPKPGSPPYVEIGASVSVDTEVCLVEVMKLFTAVRAGTAGRVAEVLASDGELVSAGQPLFVILPE